MEKLTEINTYRVRKTTVSLSDKGFKGTVVNRALPSLHGGLLEIRLIQSLN